MSRVFLVGASGTIGQATAAALVAAGHEVASYLRPTSQAAVPGTIIRGTLEAFPPLDGYDAVVSCLASRSGAPRDAWAIDHDAHLALLRAAEAGGVQHFVLLSAICVQKPRLEFQKAKLAFEGALQASGLRYSIVRPTAYFKSISGQLARVKAGKPYLMFGDGALTACKPISNRDLGRYIASCLQDPDKVDKVLPVGGPGPALTPRDIGEMLFRLTGQTPTYKTVPPGALKFLARALGLFGMKDRAEFARTGHYYATESMLVWDGARYDADATPEFGSDRLEHYLEALLSGAQADERGAHAVF
ncbi:MAG: NAD(P)H-binding protein [Pseudomonadota bacterium]